MNFKKISLLSLLMVPAILFSVNVTAQKKKKSKKNEKLYQFETVHEAVHSSVKNQQRTGTCWSFAATSFIESELMRMDKGTFDLSEMYFVRHAYTSKAKEYVRRHGLANFSEGGQAHDVMNVVKLHGFVPQEVYSGNQYGGKMHNHSEMVAMTKGMLDGLLKNKRNGLSPRWMDAVNGTFDVYLGTSPEEFTLDGKKYAPLAFAQRQLNFNTNDYVELTSYTHHPFYESFNLEVPDNWSDDFYYNLPIDELMTVMYSAIKNGYSICWDGDVSEKGFSHKNAVALVPVDEDKGKLFKEVVAEEAITQEMRQETFDQFTSTDDHLMHLIGISKDQEGNKYFITKNSWDDDSNDHGGLLNMSDAYVQLKTVAIMVHKDAIPASIAQKLNLK